MRSQTKSGRKAALTRVFRYRFEYGTEPLTVRPPGGIRLVSLYEIRPESTFRDGQSLFLRVCSIILDVLSAQNAQHYCGHISDCC